MSNTGQMLLDRNKRIAALEEAAKAVYASWESVGEPPWPEMEKLADLIEEV